MKKNIFICIFCFCYQCSMSQNKCYEDSARYLIAYEYIVNDSLNINSSIIVSDSIVDLDRYWSSGLERYPKEKEILNQYRKRKYYKYFDTYYSQCLALLFGNCKRKKPDTVLFFSQIEDFMLRADLLSYDSKWIGETRKNDYSAYSFGIGYEYLFIFNKNGTIKVVLKQKIAYD